MPKIPMALKWNLPLFENKIKSWKKGQASAFWSFKALILHGLNNNETMFGEDNGQKSCMSTATDANYRKIGKGLWKTI